MADEKKRERAGAKGRFTVKVKGVKNSITNQLAKETVESRFQDLIQAWNKLQEKHENYVMAADDPENETYLDGPMAEFEAVEISQLLYIKTLIDEEAASASNSISQKRQNSLLNKEAQIESRKTKFIESCEAITRLINTADKPEHALQAINEAVTRMQASRIDIESLHEDMIALVIEDGKTVADLKHYQWIIDTEKQFNESITAANIFTSKHTSTPTISKNETKTSGIRALKLNFDVFDGNIRKYPCFKKDFITHIKHRYSPEEEAIALKSYLSSEIKEDVSSIGDDAGKIWEHLDSKYGDPSKLIDSIMADVKSIPKCSDDCPSEILGMINTIERAHRDLTALSMEGEISNSTIVSLIERTIPQSIENDWLDVVTGTGDDKEQIRKNKFPELLKVLKKHKQRIEYKMSDIRNEETLSGGVHNASGDVRKLSCWIHIGSNHPIWKCNAFERKTIEEKLELIRSKKACHICLDTSHETSNCPRNFKCRKDSCGGAHHTLIHEAVEKGLTFYGAKSGNGKGQALLLLQRISVKHGGQIKTQTTINCLWDSGSTLSFITFSIARKLKLKGTTAYLSVTKLGGVVEQVLSQRYEIQLVGRNGQLDSVTVYALETISSQIQTVQLDQVVSYFSHNLTVASLNRPTHGHVDCLLGLNVAGVHPVQLESINHLVLYKSNYGFVLGGTHPDLQESTSKSFVSALVNHTFVRFEDIENIGVECNPKCGSCSCGQCHPGGLNMTLKEGEEYKAVEEGIKFNEERKRWEAKYPCIRNLSELPDNREAVLRNYLSTERKLSRNPILSDVYEAQIIDMKNRKVCRKVNNNEIDSYQKPIYYISHHLVSKKESKSTPHRLVFNTSAEFRGHILNDYYAKGPSMLNDMLGLLLRFCQHRVGICGDISKMYHTIDIPLEDQMTHLFFWRDNASDKEPSTYAMTTVNFGDRPSGCIAVVALRKTADMSTKEFPEACHTIKNNSYMDDILDSLETEEKAQKLMSEITEVLAKCGFTIKEWISSGKRDTYSIGKSDEERVLGMLWDSVSDVFRYRFKPAKPIPLKLTKRICVSLTHGIFDPRGLLAPFTIRAKMMIQSLWALGKKLSWDDEIPHDHAREWKQFFSEISLIENVSYKRCIKPSNAVGQPTLVLFSDGSEKAYGVCAYIRWDIGNGKYASHLVASKTKVAPLKTVTIVRLELCAAVLSKRLRVFIESEMDFEFEQVIHIVDSEIVKAMINKESHQFHTYAAHRVGEIHNATESWEWYWVSGELNIADLLTRGVHPNQLMGEWQTGPAYLQQPIKEWPIKQNNDVTNIPDLREGNNSVHLADVNIQETLLSRFTISHFSKFQILINSTARVLSLYKRFRHSNERHSNDSTITPDDLQEAETLWIKEAQKDLAAPMKDGKLIKLVPRIKNGIIVVGGRVKENVVSTWNKQEFILLPYAHRLSYLISIHMHRKSGHLGISATTAVIRSRFWIIHLQRLVKKICFECVLCKIKNKITAGQIMADLPLQRLQPSPPFYVTGIDLFGPYKIKGEVNKRSRGDCYGVIFTCFTTRAIHIDVSIDYSTDAFIQTLRRFTAIRGWPKEFRSDNGSQLVAASKELADVMANLNHDEIHSACMEGGSSWKFSAADAPWYNGVTESLIKTVKRCLHTVVGEQILSFSELQTVFYEVFQLVNQRPIGRKPTQPDEGAYLSPNDMLLGRSSANVPQGPFKERCSNKHRLDFIQSLVQQFWKRWIRDVFPNLVIQPKWHVNKRNVEVDDIVLIQDTNSLRGKYKMGVVTEVYPNSDGKVRRVQVSYKNNTDGVEYKGTKFTRVERPVQRLVVIAPNKAKADDN